MSPCYLQTSLSYDHLDWPTIDAIHKLKGTNVTFIAPLGNESWFRSGGISPDQIVELDWHEDVTLRASGKHPPVKFICTPAQHGSGTPEHNMPFVFRFTI